MKQVQDILDVVFKCSCGCGSQLAIGNFGDGQFTFSVKETVDDGQTAHWNEVVMSPKQVKKIITFCDLSPHPQEKEEEK